MTPLAELADLPPAARLCTAHLTLQLPLFDYAAPDVSPVEAVLARSIQTHLTEAEVEQRHATLVQFLAAIVAAIGVYHPDTNARGGRLRSGATYALGLNESNVRTWIVVYHGGQKTRVFVECLVERPHARIVNAVEVAQAVITDVVTGPTNAPPGYWIDATAKFSS